MCVIQRDEEREIVTVIERPSPDGRFLNARPARLPPFFAIENDHNPRLFTKNFAKGLFAVCASKTFLLLRIQECAQPILQ